MGVRDEVRVLNPDTLMDPFKRKGKRLVFVLTHWQLTQALGAHQ
jgi:hypothetical protein